MKQCKTMLAEPTPNRKTETLKEEFLKILVQTKEKGFKPNNTHQDNEVSEEHLNLLK